MIHRVRGLALMLALASLVGCVSLPELVMSDLGPVDGTYVIDESVPDRYPGVALAEGNIYSCRFGIAHIRRDRMRPPVADTFGALLAKEKPEIGRAHV